MTRDGGTPPHRVTTLPDRLREAFEDTKRNRVRDWSVLLEAAAELERLEEILAAYREEHG